MCGRYGFIRSDEFEERFGVDLGAFELKDNYNVSPGQIMPIIVENESGRKVEFAQWGIHREFTVAGGKKIKRDLINTRSDKAFTGFWSRAVKSRRCLVPASGFIEWDQILGDGKKFKQPYFIRPKKLDLFAFAGIWEPGHDKNGKEIVTFSILTTEANKEMSSLHNREPVMLRQDDEPSWLSPTHNDDRRVIETVLRPWADGGLKMFEISSDVNNPRNNYPELLYPMTAQ